LQTDITDITNIQVTKDIIIDLKNVTSIMFEETKTIFNFNYGISLKGNEDRIIPDYVYAYLDKEKKEELRKIIEEKEWINFKKSDNPNRYVNPEAISFIKFEDRKSGNFRKLRIIMNLNTSVSLSNHIFTKTSDAVYADFYDEEEFKKAVKTINEVLNVVKL
jgi:hypothetical protein